MQISEIERCCEDENDFWWKESRNKKNIEELKEDIKILNKNISEFERVLDKVNSFDEMEQYEGMDIEKGLKHIEIF